MSIVNSFSPKQFITVINEGMLLLGKEEDIVKYVLSQEKSKVICSINLPVCIWHWHASPIFCQNDFIAFGLEILCCFLKKT